MSLDKAIKHGKEKRNPYRGSKSFDSNCRNHGVCSWCKKNRLRFDKVEREKTNQKLFEFTTFV